MTKHLFLVIFILLTQTAQAATVNFDQPITAYNLIVDAEGYHPTIYVDTTGNKTCGYGFQVRYHPDICNVQDKYRHDIYLHEIIPQYQLQAKAYHNSINPDVNAVLTDFAYNIGHKMFLFKKMRHALNVGDYKTAAKEMRNSNYCKQVKTRCERNARIIEQQVTGTGLVTSSIPVRSVK